MNPLLAELEELYASLDRQDALRVRIKSRDDEAVKLMFYFDIWKRVREAKGQMTLTQKKDAMENTLKTLYEQVQLKAIYV